MFTFTLFETEVDDSLLDKFIIAIQKLSNSDPEAKSIIDELDSIKKKMNQELAAEEDEYKDTIKNTFWPHPVQEFDKGVNKYFSKSSIENKYEPEIKRLTEKLEELKDSRENWWSLLTKGFLGFSAYKLARFLVSKLDKETKEEQPYKPTSNPNQNRPDPSTAKPGYGQGQGQGGPPQYRNQPNRNLIKKR